MDREQKYSGVGIGLRPVHYGQVLSTRPAVPWFEVISENYMESRGGRGGRPLEILDSIRRDYPIALHGVSLNIGSVDPLNKDYLRRLKDLADRIKPVAVSDHLCWTGCAGENLHDLLPLPFTEEALRHVSRRLGAVQEFLGRRILIENVSSYLSFETSEMQEWEFFSEAARRSGCGLLLDVNNVYVSSVNHGFNPLDCLAGVPVRSVDQMHLAGYSEADGLLIDTHDHPVSMPVWNLYESSVRRFGPVPTLIEWDDKIPSFARLRAEASRAQRIQDAISRKESPLAR